MPRNAFKIGITISAALTLLITGALLFFEDQVTSLWQNNDSHNVGHGDANDNGKGEKRVDRGELVIAYATPLTTLEPTSFNGTDRARLNNIYEPLIRPDRNFEIEPVLAASYGMLEPDVWEITLRSNVSFHDGSALDTADIVASLERARHHESSQLKDVLTTIKKVEVINEKTLHITTNNPDPLFLNKLSTVYIFPSEAENITKEPIGTGPYTMTSWKSNESATFAMHAGYWQTRPAFSEVIIKTIPQKQARIQALTANEVDILINVPPDSVETLEGQVQIKTIPSLEVSFIMFNSKKGTKTVRDKAFREAVGRAINHDRLISITHGFARPVNQFVSNGVFGYNTDIGKVSAPTQMDDATSADFTLDMVKGLENFGKILAEMLAEANIKMTPRFLDWPELSKKIEQGRANAYFLTWRSELADSFDFLNSVAHSKGIFNGGAYRNETVDELIEESAHEMKPKKRLKSLKEAMQLIVEEEVMGIPLVEAETIFALQTGINWQPRLDGMVFAADVY